MTYESPQSPSRPILRAGVGWHQLLISCEMENRLSVAENGFMKLRKRDISDSLGGQAGQGDRLGWQSGDRLGDMQTEMTVWGTGRPWRKTGVTI